ncbi:cell division protein [Simonsiella muelleri]|uniref:cell division protein n=1 Tax=Simonsiella muelleri TaxID=72 RepID=UPI0028D0BDFE|nr:cell division protein [Simonsiella muelleri]
MKWLFATLVALNLIVFAGMIASKMLKQHMPVAATQPTQPTIIINGNDLVTKKSSASESTTPPVAAASTATTNTTTTGNNKHDSRNNNNARDDKRTRNETRNNDNRRTVVTNADIAKNTGGTSQAKYRECSARVSMPEDDYHRIKGLLGRYPHAASRQVVDNGGESAARMNVVFMQVSDQEASAIQGIVGRYGQLNRAACGR